MQFIGSEWCHISKGLLRCVGISIYKEIFFSRNTFRDNNIWLRLGLGLPQTIASLIFPYIRMRKYHLKYLIASIGNIFPSFTYIMLFQGIYQLAHTHTHLDNNKHERTRHTRKNVSREIKISSIKDFVFLLYKSMCTYIYKSVCLAT